MKGGHSILLVDGKLEAMDIKARFSNATYDEVKVYGCGDYNLKKIKSQLGSSVLVSRVERSEYDMVGLIAARANAYDQVNAIFEYMLSNNSVPLQWAIGYYQDESIGRIFEKLLVEKLSDWEEFTYLADVYSSKKYQVEILLEPSVYEVAKLAEQVSGHSISYKIQQPRHRVNDFYRLLRYAAQTVLVPLYIISKVRVFHKDNVQKPRTDVAIRLHKNIRRPNYPLNMEGCNAFVPYLKSRGLSYIFVAESDLNSEVINRLHEDSETVVDLGSQAFSRVSSRLVVRLFKGQLRITKEFLPLFARSSFLFHGLIPKLLYDYFRWEYFAQSHRINWYFTFNNSGKDHITRNIILRNHGVRTIGYSASWSDYYFLDTKSIKKFRKPSNAFSLYDTKAYMCGRQKDYDCAQGASFDQAIITGILYNPFSIAEYQPYLSLLDGLKERNKVIVSLFPASGGDKTLNDEDDLIKFFQEIEKLFNEPCFDNWVFVLKLKKPIGKEHGNSDLLCRSYHALCNSGRVIDLGHHISASLLIGASNFVVSMAFTSPTLDALNLCVPACFFDPVGKYSNTIFSDSEALIANDFRDLFESFKFFSAMSVDDFEAYCTTSLPLKCRKQPENAGMDTLADYLRAEIYG